MRKQQSAVMVLSGTAASRTARRCLPATTRTARLTSSADAQVIIMTRFVTEILIGFSLQVVELL